jgi:hypothetical protein
MKQANNTAIRSAFIVLLLALIGFIAEAQSPPPSGSKADTNSFSKNNPLLEVAIKAKRGELPEIQQISLRAPAKVKIDGKANEWNNDFHAYNHRTDIFYSIANDDDNLYLVIQAADPKAINKIVGGGITFTIQRSLKQNYTNSASITYPFYQITKGDIGVSFNLFDPKNSPVDTTTHDATVMRNNHNLQLGHLCKWIRITGIPGFDTLISVYNEDGIRATGMFDLRERYTFELKVPLKSLSLSVNEETKFAYHIQLNGANPYGPDPIPPWPGPPILTMPPMGSVMIVHRTSPVPPRGGLRAGPIQSAPTDFWAEYTLAKKP